MKFAKLALIALALTLGALVLMILWAILTGGLTLLLSQVPGLGWVDHWMFLPALIILWPHLPDRYKAWHRPYAIRGSIEIDAPASAVWNRILPRPGQPYFLSAVKRVDSIGDDPARFAFVYDDESLGADDPIPPLRSRFEEREEHAYLRLGYENTEDFPLWAGDLVSTEYYLEHLGPRTRLTMIENLDKIRPITVLSLLFLNPCKDALKRVKALCDGQDDPSWMGKINAQSIALGPDQTDMAKGIRTVGVMMCVLVTMIAFGLIYGAVWLTTLG